MADCITTHAAAAIVRRCDDGAILTDDPVTCETAEAAIECARQLSLVPHSIGAVAYTRSTYPSIGRYEDEYLKRFGGI